MKKLFVSSLVFFSLLLVGCNDEVLTENENSLHEAEIQNSLIEVANENEVDSVEIEESKETPPEMVLVKETKKDEKKLEHNEKKLERLDMKPYKKIPNRIFEFSFLYKINKPVSEMEEMNFPPTWKVKGTIKKIESPQKPEIYIDESVSRKTIDGTFYRAFVGEIKEWAFSIVDIDKWASSYVGERDHEKDNKVIHFPEIVFLDRNGNFYQVSWFHSESFREIGESFYTDRILKGMSIDPLPESKWAECWKCLAIADSKKLDPLKKIEGSNFLYEFKDPKAKHLKWLYSRFNKKDEYTYDQWLAQKPVVYYETIFGDYVRTLNSIFVHNYGWEFPVGGGKPVIYLYPETTQPVSVSVYPNGGFTITDPSPVGNTWDVVSTPESVITYQGQNYPYLFWEGLLNSKKDSNFSKGLLSTKDNIAKTLTIGLNSVGLNEKEIADFNEFWEPTLSKLMTTEYVILHFDTEILKETAPLEITPKPDNVLRVFLDYKFVNEKEKVTKQIFPKFSRDGFSVVEWGGRLDEVLTHSK